MKINIKLGLTVGTSNFIVTMILLAILYTPSMSFLYTPNMVLTFILTLPLLPILQPVLPSLSDGFALAITTYAICMLLNSIIWGVIVGFVTKNKKIANQVEPTVTTPVESGVD